MDVVDYTSILVDRIDWMRSNVDFNELALIVRNSNCVLLAGNGGSSATASHLANDLVKMCGVPSICLTDSVPLLTAYSNDDSYSSALSDYYSDIVHARFSRDIVPPKNRGNPWVCGEGVTVILFSGSGNSDNVRGLAVSATLYGSDLICVTGYPANDLVGWCKCHPKSTSICFEIDNEVVPAAMQIAEDLHMIFGHLLVRHILEGDQCTHPRK